MRKRESEVPWVLPTSRSTTTFELGFGADSVSAGALSTSPQQRTPSSRLLAAHSLGNDVHAAEPHWATANPAWHCSVEAVHTRASSKKHPEDLTASLATSREVHRRMPAPSQIAVAVAQLESVGQFGLLGLGESATTRLAPHKSELPCALPSKPSSWHESLDRSAPTETSTERTTTDNQRGVVIVSPVRAPAAERRQA